MKTDEIDEQNQNDESFDISEELDEEINFDDLPFAGRTLNEPVIDFLGVYRHNTESETNQCVVCHLRRAVGIRHSCGHMMICYWCTSRSVVVAANENTTYKCPLCRATVTNLLGLF